MKSASYQCVNCQIFFQIEADYISHYKSEHHRYNIKRKLIGLPPLSFQEYNLQFQDEKTSKQSVEQQFYCEICSKKFVNSGTYKQHLASKKHKSNRAQLKAPQKYNLSKSSSSSDFEIIGAQKAEVCLFCQSQCTPHHLKSQHNFPPFQTECVNYQGLINSLRQKIKKFECLYCQLKFSSQESVKQHMKDLSHAKIDINDFSEFEKFYLWKIEEFSSQEDQQLIEQQQLQEIKQSINQNDKFVQLNHPTLEQLQQKRLDRIQLTATGAIINGKQVGYRHLRQYYKQYLNRDLPNMKLKYQPAIQDNKSSWTQMINKTAKIPQIVQSR